MTLCRGLNKHSSSCSVKRGLNLEGYYKFHVPDAVQCNGVSRSTGHQCHIKWDLDEFGYCNNRCLGTSTDRQCIAIAQITDRRCRRTVGIDRDGFCLAHKPLNASTPLCQKLLSKLTRPV